MTDADGVAIVEKHRQELAMGEAVEVYLYRGRILLPRGRVNLL
jgi:hypothetical protein